MIDLKAHYDAMLASLPDIDPNGRAVGLCRETLPRPPAAMVTDILCITSGFHTYNNHPVESVGIESDKATLGQLGLAIFATVFHHPVYEVVLHLTHPRSTIRKLIIEPGFDDQMSVGGFNVMPVRFRYFPREVWRHPWSCGGCTSVTPGDLPDLAVTDAKRLRMPGKPLEVAVGFGLLRQACRMAEFLLNASRPGNAEVQFDLEGECGYRGVGVQSAEMFIALPGALGNLDYPPILHNDISPEKADKPR